jgi:hypothetical protein
MPASPPDRRALQVGVLVAAVVTWLVAGAGITIRAADVGAAAVDEPQYLLTAVSLIEDRDLDISDELAQERYREYHEGGLPVQTATLDGGRLVSPHDPLLPVLIAPAMAWGGFLAAKAWLVALAGLVAGGIVYVAATRFAVSVVVATATGAVTGATTPLAVYAHQVYPELPAAAAVLAAVAALVPPAATADRTWSGWRIAVLVAAITALPWLSVKYVPLAAGLAALGLWALARVHGRTAAITTAALAVSGGLWLLAHRRWYGGWTVYATGDTFQDSGEFGVIGFAPDLWGRSTRLIGLLVDRGYGLGAWQPAWLLLPLAVGIVLAARVPHRSALLLPAALGWLSAVFIALTMHGFWWPGRQIVVIVPVLAVLIAVALDRVRGAAGRVVRAVAAAAATVGVAIHLWVLVQAHTGRLMWVLAPDHPAPALLAGWRQLLPDYRRTAMIDWILHGGWVAVAVALVAVGVWQGQRSRRASAPPQALLVTTNDRPSVHA